MYKIIRKLQYENKLHLFPSESQVFVQCYNWPLSVLLFDKSHSFLLAPDIYICKSLGSVFSLFSKVLGVKYWHERGCHVKVFSSLLKMSQYHMFPNIYTGDVHSSINHVLQFSECLRSKLGINLNYKLELGQIIIGFKKTLHVSGCHYLFNGSTVQLESMSYSYFKVYWFKNRCFLQSHITLANALAL